MREKILKSISVLLAIVMTFGIMTNIVKAVDANLNLERTTGTLTINKKQVDNGVTSNLAGVTFDIYKVDDATETKEIPEGATPVNSLETGETGVVKFEDLELGRYLVVESNAPANVVSRIENFLVDIPRTEADGVTLNYDVEVTPKNNTVYGAITLNKVDENGNPMEGVEFELLRAEEEKERSLGVRWEKYNEETLITSAEGKIVVEGLPAGYYAFVEANTKEGYILDNYTGYIFTVSLDEETKRTVVNPDSITVQNEKPTINKEITTTTTDGSVKIGDTVGFKLTTDVPGAVGLLNTYEIEDTLGEGLTYDESSLVVKIKVTGPDGEQEEQILNRMSNKPEPAINEENIESRLMSLEYGYYYTEYDELQRKIRIYFPHDTNWDMSDLIRYEGCKIKIEITYNATLNNNANASAVGNNNQAKLIYSTITNQKWDGTVNTETTAEASKEVKVYTGGFWIEKRESTQAGQLLQGAKFKIATSEENARAGTYLTDNNGQEIILTTGADGKASYKGLTYGIYYLVEVESPTYEENGETKHYNLLSNPVEIEVTANTYESDAATAVVLNKKGFVLPATGGMGTIIITVVGIAVIGLGVVLVRKEQ